MPGTGRAPRGVLAVVAAALLACAGCTAPASAPSGEPTQGGREESSAGPTQSPPSQGSVGAVINLACKDGSSGLNHQGERMILGVATRVWSANLSQIDLSDGLPSYDGSTLVKSVLNVSGAARSGTRIQVRSPENAGLYYTSWDVWGHSVTAEGMVTGARRAVTVGGCGAEVVGFPGGLVVHGPSCVSLRITTGDGAAHRDLRVPIGRSCGHDS